MGQFSIESTRVVRSLYAHVKYPKKLHANFDKQTTIRAVVAHQPFTLFALLSSGRLRHLPLFYVFHSPSHEEYILNREGSRTQPLHHLPILLRRLVEKFCLMKSKRIMTLSRYMKNKVRSIHGISGGKITVNPGGVDTKFFDPAGNREALKTELGFHAGKVHLLSVRNLEPRMGLGNLLTTIYQLKQKGLPVHLVIGGEGEERKKLETLIRRYELNTDVTLVGFIPSERLPDYYKASDFFILPTRHLEGFGLVTLESMACGTPVLGTPVGGTKEILSAFDPKCLFNGRSPEDMTNGIWETIRYHFRNPKVYTALREDCRKYIVNNYSWQRHLIGLLSIIATDHNGTAAKRDNS